MLCRLFWILSAILLSLDLSYCQPRPDFYEIIKDDSIMMFFDDGYRFTDFGCSEFTRYVRIDSAGHFNSHFIDVNRENIVIGKGRYTHGLKDGYFETYHPNGKLKTKAYYREHAPTGQWEYFYENGSPERTLRFTETDTLLIRFVDESGNVTVNDGNGVFTGLVAILPPMTVHTRLKAEGEIVDGKPHGKWTGVLSKLTYCKEQYEHGRFIRGSYPHAESVPRNYTRMSNLNNFPLISYQDLLDYFRLNMCDSIKHVTARQLRIDLPRFEKLLSSELDRILKEDFRKGNTRGYTLGDNNMVVKFSVDADGKPGDYKLISSWGEQYLNMVIKALMAYGTYHSDHNVRYFHFRLTLTTQRAYRYYFWFSLKPEK
jgi:hypothetical protein